MAGRVRDLAGLQIDEKRGDGGISVGCGIGISWGIGISCGIGDGDGCGIGIGDGIGGSIGGSIWYLLRRRRPAADLLATRGGVWPLARTSRASAHQLTLSSTILDRTR